MALSTFSLVRVSGSCSSGSDIGWWLRLVAFRDLRCSGWCRIPLRPLGSCVGPAYITSMERFFPALIVLAMLATLAVLGLGLLSMARGDSARRSNKLMQSRVLLQGIALLLFIVFIWLFRRSARRWSSSRASTPAAATRARRRSPT